MSSITRIGGPTTLIEAAGWRLLTDPTFDEPGRRYHFGWGTASRKTEGPALGLESLGHLDAILVSHHQHADNLDDAGRALLATVPTVVTTRAAASTLGPTALGLAPWQATTLRAPGKPDLTITATPCRHGPAGLAALAGPVIGFSLAWEGQEHGELWVTGDTVLYPGLREVPQRLRIGTVVLHLGAVRFRYLSGPLRYSMDAREGGELLDLVNPAFAVPVHYDGWSHFSQPRAAAEPELARFGDLVRWLDPGHRVDLDV